MKHHMRYQIVRDRSYRNMRAIREQSRRKTFWTDMGSGLILLTIGATIIILNIENIGASSVIATLHQFPIWAGVLGGCMVLFGLYWIIRSIRMLISLLKIGKHIDTDK